MSALSIRASFYTQVSAAVIYNQPAAWDSEHSCRSASKIVTPNEFITVSEREIITLCKSANAPAASEHFGVHLDPRSEETCFTLQRFFFFFQKSQTRTPVPVSVASSGFNSQPEQLKDWPVHCGVICKSLGVPLAWLQASLNIIEALIFERLHQLEKVHQQVLEKRWERLWWWYNKNICPGHDTFFTFWCLRSGSPSPTSSSACWRRATA